jgi:DNA-binding beta-propeller fold protein YncE
VAPRTADATGLRGVDAIAVARDLVYVLDRAAAVVHVVSRDGRVLGRLGDGELKQPVEIAVDPAGRVFVLDAQDNSVKLLRAGAAALVFDATRLRVQAIGGIAVDERTLAVSDRVGGQVVLHTLMSGARP